MIELNREEFDEQCEFIWHVLKENEKEKGDSWRSLSIPLLEDKLREEFNEIFETGNTKKREKEVLDLSVVGIMLGIRYREFNSYVRQQEQTFYRYGTPGPLRR